jgi:hypothetical protein
MNVVVVVEMVKASPVTSKLKGVDGDDDDDVRGIIERNSRITSTTNSKVTRSCPSASISTHRSRDAFPLQFFKAGHEACTNRTVALSPNE